MDYNELRQSQSFEVRRLTREYQRREHAAGLYDSWGDLETAKKWRESAKQYRQKLAKQLEKEKC